MNRTLVRAGVLAVLCLAFASPATAQNDMGDDQDDGMMGNGMLGETAETTVLAERRIEGLPDGPLAWLVFDLATLEGEVRITGPGPGFLYAHEGSHTVASDGDETTLQEGDALFVAADADVRVEDPAGLWHSILTDPTADAPAGLEEADLLASSDRLQGLPDGDVQLRFLLVDLPMESRTAVHQHPGPEYIYVTKGEIEYETGISDTEVLQPGDHRALPAATAVQKRNPSADPAAFVSWFAVDPEMPFASDASLD